MRITKSNHWRQSTPIDKENTLPPKKKKNNEQTSENHWKSKMKRADKERVCFLHDNTRPHDTKAILDQFSRDVITHVSYSP